MNSHPIRTGQILSLNQLSIHCKDFYLCIFRDFKKIKIDVVLRRIGEKDKWITEVFRYLIKNNLRALNCKQSKRFDIMNPFVVIYRFIPPVNMLRGYGSVFLLYSGFCSKLLKRKVVCSREF